MGRRLVNGVEAGAVAADDRGLQYGDGLFETMAARDGRIRAFALHMARLEEGCARLGIPMPEHALLEEECQQVLEDLGTGVVKLVVTRGTGPRGYRPPREPTVTRVVMASGVTLESTRFTPVAAAPPTMTAPADPMLLLALKADRMRPDVTVLFSPP